MSARILIVDDEARFGRPLLGGLTAHGFEARFAADAETALEACREWRPDLVIADPATPGTDGPALCRRLRERSAAPIIVWSVRPDERIKVATLDAGADDYVTKPCGAAELLARVRARLRRATGRREAAAELRAGDFLIDLDSRRVSVRGAAVKLTPKEFELLVYFMRNAGTVVGWRALVAAVWGAARARRPENLRVFINRLRRKIEPQPACPRYLLTDPWIGYRFVPRARPPAAEESGPPSD